METPTVREVLSNLGREIIEWRQLGWTHLLLLFSGSGDQGGINEYYLIRDAGLPHGNETTIDLFPDDTTRRHELRPSWDNPLSRLGYQLLRLSVGAGFGDGDGGGGQILLALQDCNEPISRDPYRAGEWWCVVHWNVWSTERDDFSGDLNEVYDE